MSRLSFTPSPERNIYDDYTKHLNFQHDDQSVQSNFPKKLSGKENPAKIVVAKEKPNQEHDNSKLKVAKSNHSKEVKGMVSEEGKQDLKSVQPKKKKEKMGKKAVVNSKPDDQCE